MPEWIPKKYQGYYNDTDLEYHPFCTEMFAKLEAAKRDTFSKETMRVWFVEFIKRGWTKKMIAKRYNALLSKPIYGKDNIEFADWVNAVPVMAMDEIEGLVEQRINTIIQRGRFLKDKEVELSEADKKAIDVAMMKEVEMKHKAGAYDKAESYQDERRKYWKGKFGVDQ